jgi:hypothetical protein
VEGFKCDNEGIIARTGEAEETKVNSSWTMVTVSRQLPLVADTGQSSRYGTNAAWDGGMSTSIIGACQHTNKKYDNLFGSMFLGGL